MYVYTDAYVCIHKYTPTYIHIPSNNHAGLKYKIIHTYIDTHKASHSICDAFLSEPTIMTAASSTLVSNNHTGSGPSK